MADQTDKDGRDAREKAADIARQWTRRAVLGIARESGQTVTRPMFRDRPGLDMTITDAEPTAGLRTAHQLEQAARRLTREYVRQAREDGCTWHEIGSTLDLSASAAHRGISVAEAAYDHAAGDPGSEYARRYDRTFPWTCPDCRRLVRDREPSNGPADDEPGHADGCSRLAAGDRRMGRQVTRPMNDEELFDHQATAWTAGELRKALDGTPDEMPVRVVLADEPGSEFAGDEQVVISAGQWTAEGIAPSETVPPDHFEISCEFPSGQYYRRGR